MNVHIKITRLITLNILMIIMVLFVLPFTSANFVCGQVQDSNENVSSDWALVNVFYPDNLNKVATCEVSPSEKKYCCDSEAIPGKKWRAGYSVSAEIFNPEQGYFAGPVSIITTSQGYDIMPKMIFTQAIKVNYPDSRIIFSNVSDFVLNANFSQPFTKVDIKNSFQNSSLCDNCTSIEENLSGNFGMNELIVYARDSFQRSFSKVIRFAILPGYDFSRDIFCSKCNNNRVKSEEEVNFTLNLTLPYEIEGMNLVEYFPNQWELIKSQGEFDNYSQIDNSLSWNVSGQNIVRKYTLKAPKTFFLPKKYVFRSELEGKLLSEEIVYVGRFFYFFALSIDPDYGQRELSKAYLRASSTRPLVIKPENKTLIRAVIYPRQIIQGFKYSINDSKYQTQLKGLIDSYEIKTDIPCQDIEKIYFEFKVKKQLLKDEGYSNISLKSFDGFYELNYSLYEEDKDYFYYNSTTKHCNGFLIIGNKNKTNFLDILF